MCIASTASSPPVVAGTSFAGPGVAGASSGATDPSPAALDSPRVVASGTLEILAPLTGPRTVGAGPSSAGIGPPSSPAGSLDPSVLLPLHFPRVRFLSPPSQSPPGAMPPAAPPSRRPSAPQPTRTPSGGASSPVTGTSAR